jgi:hypothetical protein
MSQFILLRDQRCGTVRKTFCSASAFVCIGTRLQGPGVADATARVEPTVDTMTAIQSKIFQRFIA